jgi:hypothetical protein
MSEHPSQPRNPTSEPDDPRAPETKRMTRNVPPLAWVIGAIFLGWFAVMALQPVLQPGRPDDAVMPGQPSTSTSPATPPSTGYPDG